MGVEAKSGEDGRGRVDANAHTGSCEPCAVSVRGPDGPISSLFVLDYMIVVTRPGCRADDGVRGWRWQMKVSVGDEIC